MKEHKYWSLRSNGTSMDHTPQYLSNFYAKVFGTMTTTSSSETLPPQGESRLIFAFLIWTFAIDSSVDLTILNEE